MSLLKEGQRRVRDDLLPGFGITIGTRTKTFFVMFGATRNIKTLGRYPDVSLKEARDEARRYLSDLKPETRVEGLKALSDAFLDDCKTRLRPNSVHAYDAILKNAPDIPLHKVNKTTVTVVTAHEIKTYKALFNWAIQQEIVDRNPFVHMTAKFGQRDRVLADDELRAIWHYHHPPYSTYLRLLILTGQRIGQFKSYEVRDDTLHFPATIMKAGVAHTIPLTDLTREELGKLYPFNGFSKAKARLDKHLNLPPFVHHDLRRTFSTTMAYLQVPLHVTEFILAHRTGQVSGVAAVYNRYDYMREMRTALATYEQHVQTVIA